MHAGDRARRGNGNRGGQPVQDGIVVSSLIVLTDFVRTVAQERIASPTTKHAGARRTQRPRVPMAYSRQPPTDVCIPYLTYIYIVVTGIQEKERERERVVVVLVVVAAAVSI